MAFLKGTGAVLGLIVAVLAMGYLFFTVWSFYQPKYEAVRRDVMIESRAYSEATTRNIYRYKLQYESASTEAEKQSIKAVIRHEVQAFDRTRLPQDLQLFIRQIGV